MKTTALQRLFVFWFILIFVLLGYSGSPQKDTTSDQLQKRNGLYYEKDSKKPYTGRVVDTKPYGTIKATYKDGKLDGPFNTWHKNGKKMQECIYKDGKIEGKSTSWHSNGQKDSVMIFKDGKKVGKWTSWHKNGKKRREATFKDGKPTALMTEWHDNGKKALEMTHTAWVDGKMTGTTTSTSWHRNGRKAQKVTYIDGNMISILSWDSNGNVIKNEKAHK